MKAGAFNLPSARGNFFIGGGSSDRRRRDKRNPNRAKQRGEQKISAGCLSAFRQDVMLIFRRIASSSAQNHNLRGLKNQPLSARCSSGVCRNFTERL